MKKILFATFMLCAAACFGQTGYLVTVKTGAQTQPFKAGTAQQADSLIFAATGVKTSTDSLLTGQPYFYAEIYIEKKALIKTKSGKTKLKKLRK